MKATYVIAAAAIACACGGGTERSAQSGSTVPASNSRGAGNTAENPVNQAVALEGCLRGPSAPEATGTAGSRDRARAGSAASEAAEPTSGGRYRLVNAKPASPDAAGTAANGAGGSGGPLVSGQTIFDLDAVPADALDDVNKQVRVTGRLAANEVAGEPRAIGGSGTQERNASGGGTTGTSGAAGPSASSANRKVVVETVQVVADKCVAQPQP
jgi:hypothetical protein